MSTACTWISKDDYYVDNMSVELYKPLSECAVSDFNDCAIIGSYDLLNNTRRIGTLPQFNSGTDSQDSVWYSIGGKPGELDQLYLCTKPDTAKFYRRTIVLAIPLYSDYENATVFTNKTDSNVYLVSNIDKLDHCVMVHNVVYRDDYYRSTQNHKRAIVGSGLGLSIVKAILENHNAKFGVQSTPGVGSTFWFTLKTV